MTKPAGSFLALTLAAALVYVAEPAQGCPVCFGNADSELTQGAASGVLFMVLLTYCLLLGLGGMMTFWAVRARRLRLANSQDIADGRPSRDA